MKTCFKCGDLKPLTEFYKHPAMADGHVNKCKSCNKRDVIENREKKVVYYRDYDKRRFENDANRRASHQKASIKYTHDHPDRRNARTKARRAVLAGKLVKTACEWCSEVDTEMHHPDYTKPLEVMWLCKLCHEKWHKQFGDAKSTAIGNSLSITEMETQHGA